MRILTTWVRVLATWVCLGLILPLTALAQTAGPPSDDVTQQTLKFARVYSLLDHYYMSDLDPGRAIEEGAIRGMLARLDPFSAFFNKDQFEALQQQVRGEAVGFGSILFVEPGKVIVLETAEGSPSARAGLGPGDEIVAVNGTRIAGLDFQSLIHLLQESRSHPVQLSVLAPGSLVSHEYKLSPAEVALPTIDKAFLLDQGIGYIHLDSFESKSAQELEDAIQKLSGSNLKGLIFDLRDNHGGMIDAALGISSVFLPHDSLVLTVRGRSSAAKSYRTFKPPLPFAGPLVVLVNQDTASAAEVVAAALQDHDRGLIAGQGTFGKGVVESIAPLSELTGIALTTAVYFTPSGRSIQKPLAGTELEKLDFGDKDHAAPNGAAAFHTDNGRPVAGGGGVTPDVKLAAPPSDPWISFLDQRGLFTSFASEYITRHSRVQRSFQPDNQTLQDFRDFLTYHRIRSPQEYWTADQEAIRTRIRTELFNLVFGLDAGNEVQVKSDPEVIKAEALFKQVPIILSGPKNSVVAAGQSGRSTRRISQATR